MNDGYEYSERVGSEAAGRTVLGHLAARYRHSDEETWRARIAAGEVTLAGAVASPAEVLRSGQRLVWRRPPWSEPPVPLGLALLHRDDDLLAIAKPRGLPALPGGGFLHHTLLYQVRRRWPEATPLHRLGRGTSGLILLARTRHARRIVSSEWRAGRVEKTYRALVNGAPSWDELDIEVPIGPVPHPRLGWVHAAAGNGKPSSSRAYVIARRGDSTVLGVRIRTGRPHQIRIHLAAVGHPLLGDPLYADGGALAESPGLPGDVGYWLHAGRLALAHPGSGLRLELTCAPPPVLRC